jgi:hypothetical protein
MRNAEEETPHHHVAPFRFEALDGFCSNGFRSAPTVPEFCAVTDFRDANRVDALQVQADNKSESCS